jgi:hypothetical protein
LAWSSRPSRPTTKTARLARRESSSATPNARATARSGSLARGNGMPSRRANSAWLSRPSLLIATTSAPRAARSLWSLAKGVSSRVQSGVEPRNDTKDEEELFREVDNFLPDQIRPRYLGALRQFLSDRCDRGVIKSGLDDAVTSVNSMPLERCERDDSFMLIRPAVKRLGLVFAIVPPKETLDQRTADKHKVRIHVHRLFDHLGSAPRATARAPLPSWSTAVYVRNIAGCTWRYPAPGSGLRLRGNALTR